MPPLGTKSCYSTTYREKIIAHGEDVRDVMQQLVIEGMAPKVADRIIAKTEQKVANYLCDLALVKTSTM